VPLVCEPWDSRGASRPALLTEQWRPARALLALALAAAAAAQETEPLKTDSRAPYVHRITLYAGDGAAINPKDPRPQPYSPRATCGKCHPYAEIRDGWHFNAADPDVPAGRPGEPWFLVDEKTGGVRAISGRDWPGVVTPQQAGLSHWQFVLRFGHHTPGGGFGTPPGEALRGVPDAVRWNISGRLEIDCMLCHSADAQYDPAEWGRQIEAQNFQWAPTVALGLAVIRGEARKLPDDLDPEAPPDPDYPDRTPPKLVYDRRLFDLDDRVLFNITRRPSPDRCYFCHSFREVGPRATEEMLASTDVHLAAGLTCVDCHRNEMDHEIVRGYETEAAERGEPWRAAYSCAGCHLGTSVTAGLRTGRDGKAPTDWEGEAPAEPAAADPRVGRGEQQPATARLGGRYGAPHPEHRGLPPVHFEKLTCTACHAGPWPEMDVRRFQTALAHGLGSPTRERRDDQPPEILGPVFARQHDGKIAPQRTVWTSDRTAAADQPYRWSLAHDVRPAAQSLGVRGCEDCHDFPEAPIFTGRIERPTDGDSDRPRTMLDARNDDPVLVQLWDCAFGMRPLFKLVGFTCAALLALLVLRALLDVVYGRVCPMPTTSREATPKRSSRAETAFRGVGIASAVVAAGAAFGPEWLGHELGGYLLLVHMGAAGLFLLGVTGGAVYWQRRIGSTPGAATDRARRALVWLLLVCSLVVTLTMLVNMLPLVGTDGQRDLIEWHERAGIALLILGGIYIVVVLAGRRAKGMNR
jgi:nitrate/TMAO reductase-like tetraheme cytochrome c subunit